MSHISSVSNMSVFANHLLNRLLFFDITTDIIHFNVSVMPFIVQQIGTLVSSTCDRRDGSIDRSSRTGSRNMKYITTYCSSTRHGAI